MKKFFAWCIVVGVLVKAGIPSEVLVGTIVFSIFLYPVVKYLENRDEREKEKKTMSPTMLRKVTQKECEDTDANIGVIFAIAEVIASGAIYAIYYKTLPKADIGLYIVCACVGIGYLWVVFRKLYFRNADYDDELLKCFPILGTLVMILFNMLVLAIQ